MMIINFLLTLPEGNLMRISPMRISPIRFKQTGQGMTEYIIIVALIAVAAIAVYQFFGQTVRSQMAGIAQEVSGQSAGTAIGNAQGTANSAMGEGTTKKGLDAYQNENSQSK
jgi:Flp pilus assembly pilin Flp